MEELIKELQIQIAQYFYDLPVSDEDDDTLEARSSGAAEAVLGRIEKLGYKIIKNA